MDPGFRRDDERAAKCRVRKPSIRRLTVDTRRSVRNMRGPRGNSSVGRARPCQGRGREFESRFPLHVWFNVSQERCPLVWLRLYNAFHRPGADAKKDVQPRPSRNLGPPRFFVFRTSPARWQSGYAAACKAAYAGSIPTLASITCRRSTRCAFPSAPVPIASAKVPRACHRASASRAFRSNVPLRVAIERTHHCAHIARHEFVEIVR